MRLRRRRAITSMEGKRYSVSGPKGLPFIGFAKQALQSPLQMTLELSQNYGDIIPLTVMGQRVIQLNHPDLIRYVLVDNHKNYKKSSPYIRFESVLGKGLFTSEGEKWRRDQQKIQPMFKREQLEGYYFDVMDEIVEKFKRRWFGLIAAGDGRINITSEMADITLEIVAKLVFGRHHITDQMVADIHHAYDVFMDYLKNVRLFPTLDLRKAFRMPSYGVFSRELAGMKTLFTELLTRCKKGGQEDRLNMMALLVEAQKSDPEHFTDEDILDQCFTVIFAGFESTSILMQWMWKALDERPDVKEKIRQDIRQHAPYLFAQAGGEFCHQDLSRMDYLTAFFHESTRLYPPFWITGRQPINDDWLGDYRVKKGTVIVLPHFAMHRHPRYWKDPNALIPERFLPLADVAYDAGIFFPFSHGPRKCSGNKLTEMEAKIVFAKLLPLFDALILNSALNGPQGGISLKPAQPLRAELRRCAAP
jgi:cytochrome P450